jgi:hypothetical protein
MQTNTNYVSGSVDNDSIFNYDDAGNLQFVDIDESRDHRVFFINDPSGQILYYGDSLLNPQSAHAHPRGHGLPCPRPAREVLCNIDAWRRRWQKSGVK